MDLRRIINKITLGALCISLLAVPTACEDDLQDLNLDPNAINSVPYGTQFTKFQLYSGNQRYEIVRASLGYGMSSIQQFADLETSGNYLPGDKYLDNVEYAGSLFEESYINEYRDLADFLSRTSADEDAINYYAMGRIWSAISFHRTTDLYGDIPYFGAGKGYLDNNWFPEYDAQKDIYLDMLQGLEEGANLLNASMETPGKADLVYGSNIEQWKKLAYSFMLRLGLRMQKVDPAASELWVKKAIAGGVMTSNDDTCFFEKQTEGGWVSTNPFGETFNNDKHYRLSKTLVDYLIDNGDPRLDVIGWVESGNDHKGLPNGYNAVSIQDYPDWTDLIDYTQVNPALVTLDSPTVFMTYAEVELMLAEAAQRGWSSGVAGEHYNKGVAAAMTHWAIYGEEVVVPTLSEINSYLTSNPYDAENGLEMIGEQYWVATFLNAWEGYSNWRRTGFPVLTPVNYPGNVTNGTIPRRLVYPTSEYSINPDNIKAAVTRQGPDTYTTRIWWDN